MAVNRFEFSGLVDTRNAKNVIRNADGTKRTEYFPNMDYLYGPYNSLQEAFTALSAGNTYGTNALVKGKTVGIINTYGEIEEYWFKKAKPAAGYTVDDLEEKGGSTPVDLKELTVGDTIKSFGTIFLYDGKVTHHRAVYHTTDSNDAWDVAIHPTTGSYNNNHETIFCCEHDAEEDGYESGYRYYIFDNAGMKLIGVVDDSGEDSEVTNGVPQYIRVAFGENLQDEVDALKSDKAPYPSSKTDGKQYVMKNGEWVEVVIETDARGITYTKDAEGNTTGTVGKALDSLASEKANLSDVDVQSAIAAKTAAESAKDAAVLAKGAAEDAKTEAVSAKNILVQMLSDDGEYQSGVALVKNRLVTHSGVIYRITANVTADDNTSWDAVSSVMTATTIREFVQALDNATMQDVITAINNTNTAIANANSAATNATAKSAFVGVEEDIAIYDPTKTYVKGQLFAYNNGTMRIYRVTNSFQDKSFAEALSEEYIEATSLYKEIMRIVNFVDVEHVLVTVYHYSLNESTGGYEHTVTSGNSVSVSINGADANTYQTDSYGQCSFDVPIGSNYIVSIPDAGNAKGMSQSYRASLAQREIAMTYYENRIAIKSDNSVYIQPDSEGKTDWTKIVIDQTKTDPTAMITRINEDGINWIRKNSHCYLAKYTGNDDSGRAKVTVCQLNDSNRNYYHDGTVADLTGKEGDVMTRIASFWYYCDTDGNNTNEIVIWLSRTEIVGDGAMRWNGEQLIGTFESRLTTSNGQSEISLGSTKAVNSYGRSVCNISAGWLPTPSNNTSNNAAIYKSDGDYPNTLIFYNKAFYNRGLGTDGESGFCGVTWEQQCIMAVLYYSSHPETTNSQNACGAGTHNYMRVMGCTTNVLGMKDTNASIGTQQTTSAANTTAYGANVNFFGCENWWGNKTEIIGNVMCKSQSSPNLMTVCNPFDLGKSLRTVQAAMCEGKYPRKLKWGKYLDIVSADSTGGSDSIGYCDYQYFSAANISSQAFPRAVCRSDNSAYASGGCAYVYASNAVTHSSAHLAARLAFIGTISEAESVTAFKAVSDATFNTQQ